jgi:dienelactone hydrolase
LPIPRNFPSISKRSKGEHNKNKGMPVFCLSGFLFLFSFSAATRYNLYAFFLAIRGPTGRTDAMKITVLLLTIFLTFASAYGQQQCMGDCDFTGEQPCVTQGNHPNATEIFATADGENDLPLFWDVYRPSSGSQWPVVILIHDGGFEMGARCDGKLPCIARDLTASGFAVVSIDVRKDKVTGGLPCQDNAAFSPQFSPFDQASDVKKAILAARSPSSSSILYQHVTGKVGAVGGSGGGAHAAWFAATGTPDQDKLDAAVCLSGAYKFDDNGSLSTPNPGSDPPKYGFCENVTDYCKVVRGPSSCTDMSLVHNQDLHAGSPLYQMQINGGVPNTSPLYAFATTQDFMPEEQFSRIQNKLNEFNDMARYQAKEFNPKFDPITEEYNKHSFSYWFDATDDVPTTYVNELAKDFLTTYLMPTAP